MMQEAIFVKYLEGNAKATGKPYRILECSNGIRSKVFSVSQEIDSEEIKNLKEGDSINIEIEFDPFSEYPRPTVVSFEI